MRRHLVLLSSLLLVGGLLQSAVAAAETGRPVTIRVVDQTGTEIPGSEILVPGNPTPVPTGSTVTLDIGSHDFKIFPGVTGVAIRWSGGLGRTETFDVEATTTGIDFTWATETFRLHVPDQEGVDIPGACVELIGNGWPVFPTGASVTLPVTDEGKYPTMFGVLKDGYPLNVFPGIQGRCASPFDRLGRIEYLEVSETTSVVEYQWITSEVRLSVVDQYGLAIPGSGGELVWNGWGPRIDNGTSVVLPITDEAVYPTLFGSFVGGHKVDLHPGILGGYGGVQDRLGRVEYIEVAETTTLVEYEWITSDVHWRLMDQHGVDIPGSAVQLIWNGWAGLPRALTGATLTLPITDESVYPTMFGARRDGYNAFWYPGIRGAAASSGAGTHLMRTEIVEVDASTRLAWFEWITSDVEIHLVDQFGADIPGSTAGLIFHGGWNGSFFNGETVTLPITDESVYPTMGGNQVDGYHVYWKVAANGASLGYYQLSRLGKHEVDASTVDVTREWWVHSCQAQLVDEAADPVPGSSMKLPFYGWWVPGTEYRYPVNSSADYAEIFGSYADGYEFTVYPTGYPGASATVPFVFRIGGAIEPPSLEIDGVAYALSCNQPPLVDAGGPYEVLEGGTVSLTATGSDPEGNELTYEWDLDGDGVFETPGRSVMLSAALLDGPTTLTVAVRASDGALDAAASATVNVLNAAPTIESVTVSDEPVPIGDPLAASATFSDPAGPGDGPFTCLVDFGDGAPPAAGTVVGDTCQAPPYHYVEPGVYTLGFTVTDADGATSTIGVSPLLVVFDASAGHVTGGGMIMSPPGALVADPAAEGKATFGFVARYRRGANVPDGNTQFVFHAGDLQFHSESYDWLVVAGSKAMFKGEGRVNGEGGYGFLLSAIDADLNTHDAFDTDMFRIKIWDLATGDLVYDSNLGGDDTTDPATPITSGQIRIHS